MRFIDNNTVEVTATFTEPNASVDGSPLTDLDYSTVYIITPAGTIKSPAIQETQASGGGNVTINLLVTALNGVKTTLKFAASSTDTSGNEGARTAEVSLVIDRVGPDIPLNFSVA